jgi:DNA-directed RNA polymerase subunit RPC12/RpoP
MAIKFKVNEKDARGNPLTKPEGPLATSQDFNKAFSVQLGVKPSRYVKEGHSKPPPTIEASGVNTPNICDGWTPNGLLGAVDAAFNRHYPLALSPDDIWLTIAQGFARHVDANAEALRSRFVQHEGKKELLVVRDSFVKGSAANDWQGVFGEFSDQIGEHIGKQRDLVVSAFSTTGPVERAASEVVLMDAMRNYFEYRVSTMCGIPEVTLLGTQADWKSVQQRAEVLAEYDLGWWTKPLSGILQYFVRAFDGPLSQEDQKFWQSIYHQGGGSGGPFVTGWIQFFFPYVEDWKSPGKYTCQNSTVLKWGERPASELRHRDTGFDSHHGPTVDSVPPSLSKVDFKWSYYEQEFPMEFVAGLLGYSQDPETLVIRPSIGWAVRDRPEVYIPPEEETVDRSFACHKCKKQLSAKPRKMGGEVEVTCPDCGQLHYCSAKEVSVDG